MQNRARPITLPVLAIALCATVLCGTPLFAQSESSDVKYVEIISIKVREDGNKHLIDLKAKAPKLPVGCKVQFILTWNYQRIQTYVVEVPSSRRIEESLTIKDYSPSPQHYVMRTQLLEPKDQPRKIRKEIESDPKTFPPGGVPWAEHHEEKKFLIGTAAEIQAEVDRIQGWFKERYLALAAIDKLVSNSARAVSEGTEFVNGKGEFEEKKWRKLMDTDVLKPIREYQKEFEEGLLGKRGDMIAYRFPLADLRELSRAVALRATAKSIALYEEQGLEPAKEDTEPEEVSTVVRGFKRKRLPKSSDLGKMVQRINDALGIGQKKADKEGAR